MREASTLIDRRVMHLPAGVESGFSNHLVECIVQAAVLRMTELHKVAKDAPATTDDP